VHVVDDPEEVCAIIHERYKDRIAEAHPERRDKMKKGV
jgi:hypothetical protein